MTLFDAAPTGELPHELIDTHCHLDDPVFDSDRGSVLTASVRAGVTSWVNVGYRPERWTSTIELSRETVGMAHMVGLHPQHAGEWSPAVRDRLETLLLESGAVALGEIGLDYARNVEDRPIQRGVFEAQLELAEAVGLGVVIHQRAAESDVAELLEVLDPNHPVLLHSFDANDRLLSLARDRGYMIGVGGLATRRQAEGLRETLRGFPIERIVLESDSPYLVPAGQRASRNTPAQIPVIARFLADLKGIDLALIARITCANARRFFGPLQTASVEILQ